MPSSKKTITDAFTPDAIIVTPPSPIQRLATPAATPLLASTYKTKIKVEKKRWYILSIFAYFACEQCICWLTFSSALGDAVVEYYGISATAVSILLYWGPVVYILVAPFVCLLLTKQNGLRLCMLCGVWVVFLGCCIRTIPCFLSETSRQKSGVSIILHVGQILVALACPAVMSSVAQLSCTWFPDSERALATAIAYFFSPVGLALSFVLGQLIVKESKDVPKLLYLEVAISVVPLAFITFFFPASPMHPPSPAARTQRLAERPPLPTPNTGYPKVKTLIPRKFIRCLQICFQRLNSFLLISAAGLEAGVSAGWTLSIQKLLVECNFSEEQSLWMTFSNVISAISGCFLSSALAAKILPSRLKVIVMTEFLLAIACFLWLSLSLPLPFLTNTVLPSSMANVFTAMSLAGFFQGSMYPIFLEMEAEATFPVNEGTSTGLIALLYNVLLLVICVTFNYAPLEWLNPVETVVLIVSCLLTFFARVTYTRRPTLENTCPALKSDSVKLIDSKTNKIRW